MGVGLANVTIDSIVNQATILIYFDIRKKSRHEKNW